MILVNVYLVTLHVKGALDLQTLNVKSVEVAFSIFLVSAITHVRLGQYLCQMGLVDVKVIA